MPGRYRYGVGAVTFWILLIDGTLWPAAQLWLADADGGNARQITFPDGHGLLNRSPAWSPDGASLLFNAGQPTTWRSGALKRLTVASGAITQVVAEGLLPSYQPVKQTKDTVRRVWGQNQLQTAIAASRYAFADHDGASLGVRPDRVLVLCEGHRMPAATAAYLNGIDPDTQDVVCVGGWALPALQNAYAAGMLPSWANRDGLVYEVSGERAEDTAVEVAKFFWTSPNRFAVATTSSWYDALTGGAAIGTARGPLVITGPNQLDGVVRSYLSACSPTANEVVMLGGRLALPESMVAKLGAAIAEPGGWQAAETTPSSAAPAGLRAALARGPSLTAAEPPAARPRPARVRIR